MLPELDRSLTWQSAHKLADANHPGVEALLGADPGGGQHPGGTEGQQLKLDHPETWSIIH